MPLKGFRCPPGGEVPGRTNEIAYCLGACKAPCTTVPLLAAIYRSDTTNYHEGNYISASLLSNSGCDRQVHLERHEPFYEEPRRRYWAFRGTHAHSIIEGAQPLLAPYGWFQEMKLSVPLEYDLPAPVFDEQGVFTGSFDENRALVITLNGTLDAYNPYQRIIVDAKTQSDKKVLDFIRGKKPGATLSPWHDDAHCWQLNVYRYLVTRTYITDQQRTALRAFGLPEIKGRTWPSPTKLVIQAVSPMEIPHSNSVYPFREERRGVTAFEIGPIPVFTMAEIEAYIKPLALKWFRYLQLGQVPPVVGPAKAWLCKSCAFNGELFDDGICFPAEEREHDACQESAAPFVSET